jgi:hypothetical protein
LQKLGAQEILTSAGYRYLFVFAPGEEVFMSCWKLAGTREGPIELLPMLRILGSDQVNPTDGLLKEVFDDVEFLLFC